MYSNHHSLPFYRTQGHQPRDVTTHNGLRPLHNHSLREFPTAESDGGVFSMINVPPFQKTLEYSNCSQVDTNVARTEPNTIHSSFIFLPSIPQHTPHYVLDKTKPDNFQQISSCQLCSPQVSSSIHQSEASSGHLNSICVCQSYANYTHPWRVAGDPSLRLYSSSFCTSTVRVAFFLISQVGNTVTNACLLWPIALMVHSLNRFINSESSVNFPEWKYALTCNMKDNNVHLRRHS